MTKPISRQQHGLIDYAYVPLVAAAPMLAHFTDQPMAIRLARLMSGTALASALFTRAEWGLVKAVPFKTHLIGDATFGSLGLAAPWLFGFASHTRARHTFLAIGALGFMASLLSRPDDMPTASPKKK